MYTGLFHTHSLLRYFILIALVVVIIKAILGLVNKQSYGKWDNKLGLYLFIFTHMQLLIGLIIYFMNLSNASSQKLVHFGSETMSTPGLRYWTVEHVVMMLIAIVFITLARTTSKRMATDEAKHKRMLIFNGIALAIIVATIMMSGRPLV
ncbi:MAG TPA: hypothetical protein VJ184_01180 [Chryseolinea sp.]|nr:hypothetical protein [Chryseolinea sp.]